MRAAWGAHTEAAGDSPPAAMCLSAAADNLAAGRDLLHTHFTTDQFGWRHGTSPWAAAIASRQVTGALAGEIGSYAGHLAARRAPVSCRGLSREAASTGPGALLRWSIAGAGRLIQRHRRPRLLCSLASASRGR